MRSCLIGLKNIPLASKCLNEWGRVVLKRQKKDPKQMFGENQEHAQLNSNEEISEERVNQEELFHGEKKFRSGLGILSILFFFLMFTLE